MRKMYTLFAVFSLVILSILFLRYYSENMNDTNTPQEINYKLIYQNNAVSLYHGDKYVRSYDIAYSTLPPTDRDNLKSGIILNSIEEVNRLIEDFDGH